MNNRIRPSCWNPQATNTSTAKNRPTPDTSQIPSPHVAGHRARVGEAETVPMQASARAMTARYGLTCLRKSASLFIGEPFQEIDVSHVAGIERPQSRVVRCDC